MDAARGEVVDERLRRSSDRSRPRSSGAYVYFLIGTVGFLLFWREVLESRFNLIPGDTGDARLALSILEHWSNVFHGQGQWLSPSNLYPVQGVLGYTDTYFFYGVLHWICRRWLDPFGSLQLVVMALTAFSYCAMCLLLRKVFGLRPWICALGGALFAWSSLNASRLGHVQLLIAFVYPLLVLVAHRSWTNLEERPAKALLCAGLAGALLAVALFTSYNAIWLFCFFLGIWLAVAALAWPRGAPWPAEKRWRTAAACVIFLAVLAAGLVPFLLTYLPMVRMGYGVRYPEMWRNLPRVLDLINVGPFNWTWGRILPRIFPSTSFEKDSGFYEHILGFPLVFLGFFAFAVGSAWSRRGRPVPRDRFVLVTGFAIALCWILMLHAGELSAWRLVLAAAPGARGVRAVFRFQVTLYFFAVVVAALELERLAQQSWAGRKWLAACLPLALVAEQASQAYAHIGKREQRERFARIGPPPAECTSFFAQAEAGARGVTGTELSIDAMLVSVFHHIPTINGYNGQGPPNYAIVPGSPGYDVLVAEWLVRNRLLEGVCSLDLDTGAWRPVHATGAVPMETNLLAPDPHGSVSERMWAGMRDFAGVGMTSGEWSTGNSTVILVRPTYANELELTFSVQGMPQGNRVAVFLDDESVLKEKFPNGVHTVRVPVHRPILGVRVESDRLDLGEGRFHVFKQLGIHLSRFVLR
jgi:hypothetical protein